MKVRETLTQSQTLDLLNGQTVGFFNSAITSEDVYYNLVYDLCLGYYIERSGDKTISSAYSRLLEIENTSGGQFRGSAHSVIGRMLRNKFREKWTKQYKTLLTEQYNPLNDFEYTENINRDNTDTSTYDTTIINDSTKGSKVTRQYTDTDDDKIYGFNSSSGKNSNSSTSTSTETTTGLANDNTSNSEESKTGTDTKRHIAEESKNKRGRNISASELIDAELDMRNRQIFFDIVYADIDSIVTIGVYTYEPDEFEPIKEYKFGSITITSNGTYPAINEGLDGFNYVVVNVHGEVLPTYNGEVVFTNAYN